MSTKNTTIGIVLTCHNRKDKTLKCLHNLFSQTGIDSLEMHIYLVDDGSTDGTTEAVINKYPSINIIKGDGTLFWNGGMRIAFAKAIEDELDYYIWLNDDTFLFDNALKQIFDTANDLESKNGQKAIVVGTIRDDEAGQINYGGRVQKSKFKPLTFLLLGAKSESQLCDTFNGNIVLIPHEVAHKVGNISHQYSKQHSGDFDYGLRAKYAGFESWVAPGVVGECENNSLDGSIYDRSLPIRERMKKMKSPRGVPPAKEWMIFSKRHAGFLWPYYWLRTILRIIFPWTYLLLRKPQQ